MKNKVLLCILDGWGHGKDYKGNAVTRAKTPFLSELQKSCPWTLLCTSGVDVGTPKGNQGGSEVGHLTIGAGRIVPQALLAIDTAIKDGVFFKMKALVKAAEHAKKRGSAFHILGMISDQGVHSNVDHCLALLTFAKKQGLKKVYIHAITDGRDVPPKSAEKFIKKILAHTKKLGIGKIATIVGRFYAMDRDSNLDRTQKAYDLYTSGKSAIHATSALAAIRTAYASGLESDYYLEPTLLDKSGLIRKEDSVVFFNFRTDRAAQITEFFLTELKPYFVAFGPYTAKAPVLFPEPKVKNNLATVLASHHLKQLRIAETEKFAHVTFFMNSQVHEPAWGEKHILIPSPKCPSYADKPEMSAPLVTKTLLKEIQKKYDFIALNFANLDLVGHSGNFAAAVKAVETIDSCLLEIVPAALEAGYTVFITGDHGNAEYMIYEKTGGPCPSHTVNPVKFIVVSLAHAEIPHASHMHPTGGLKDIAPTVLSLLGVKKPKEMTGKSLVI
jgi:2,3-bisphosphoglycerate-independent phosphoglycerate mutase